jgi:Mn-containing catalase
MTREITHMKAFSLALETMGKPPLVIGRIAPTAGLVEQFFNDSTGKGDEGEADVRGPWNEGDDWEFVQAPAFKEAREEVEGPDIIVERSAAGGSAEGPAQRRKATGQGSAEDGQGGV